MKGFLVILFLVLIFAGPLLTIASLNTLFNTGISYSFASYLAVLWLQAVLVTKVSK